MLITALAASSAVGAQETVLQSKAFPHEDLPVPKANGIERRTLLLGKLRAGCPLEVRQTRLASGAMPHPAHHHLAEEMFLVREGMLELTINGQATRLGPGSVGFVGSNDEHGTRNLGTTPAEYFVIKLGKDA